MAGLLRGWHLSAVQRSSLKFRHFSEASLIRLYVIGSSNLGWNPCEDTLLRYPLEHRSAKAHRTHTTSSLKTDVCDVLVIGRDLGWRSILMTGFKQWKISPLFKVWSMQGLLVTNEGGLCNLSLFTPCSSGLFHILSKVRPVTIPQPSVSTLTQRQNTLPAWTAGISLGAQIAQARPSAHRAPGPSAFTWTEKQAGPSSRAATSTPLGCGAHMPAGCDLVTYRSRLWLSTRQHP